MNRLWGRLRLRKQLGLSACLLFAFCVGAWPAQAQTDGDTLDYAEITRPSPDGCNTCVKTGGVVVCTLLACIPTPGVSLPDTNPPAPAQIPKSAIPGVSSGPDFSLQMGAIFEPSATPRASGDFTLLIGSGTTRSYTTINARPITRDRITYSFRTGVERDFLSTKRASIVLCGQAGVATGAQATSGIFSGCASVIVPIRSGFSFVLSGEAQNAPADTGHWEPRVLVGFRYKFE